MKGKTRVHGFHVPFLNMIRNQMEDGLSIDPRPDIMSRSNNGFLCRHASLSEVNMTWMYEMVPRGLEPRTLRLLAVRSNQLSYETLSSNLKKDFFLKIHKSNGCIERQIFKSFLFGCAEDASIL